jgi:cytochrome c biogenesis protein CcmG/thiol:disulfide interchange protein DsbE
MAELVENTPAPDLLQKKKRPRQLLILCVVCLVNVVLLALLLTQLLTPASNTTSDPLVGQHAPDFSLALLHPQNNQNMLSLSDLQGKPVVLNFWATWCAPCKEELPLLEQTWKQLQAQGADVVFLGIDFQETRNDAASFLQLYSITYPILLDGDGAVTLKFGITALPQTVFINRAGVVAARIPGELTAQTLSKSLQLIG